MVSQKRVNEKPKVSVLEENTRCDARPRRAGGHKETRRKGPWVRGDELG